MNTIQGCLSNPGCKSKTCPSQEALSCHLCVYLLDIDCVLWCLGKGHTKNTNVLKVLSSGLLTVEGIVQGSPQSH